MQDRMHSDSPLPFFAPILTSLSSFHLTFFVTRMMILLLLMHRDSLHDYIAFSLDGWKKLSGACLYFGLSILAQTPVRRIFIVFLQRGKLHSFSYKSLKVPPYSKDI